MSDASPGAAASRTLPQIDFAHYLVTLGNTALVSLGEIPHPDGSTQVDRSLARHTIEVLRLLKQKTSGNLDEEEARLLDALLSELDQKLSSAS